MRTFKNHNLLTEFIENLFEFNILTRAKGSIGTWASGKFEKLPGWFKDGFSNAGIPLTNTSTFEIVDGAPEDNNPIIGNPTKDIVVYTNVYDTPNGNLQGTVAWTQDPSKSFKELKQGTAIAWGSNTDALESAQCMGVYLKVDDALADVKKLGVATAKTNWNPQIKSVLSNGQDWDKGGVSKLVSKIDNMPDANWLEMLFLAKGMKNFIDKEGKNIGSTYHIIHGSIKKYYEAEIKNQTTTADSKDNTADMILANVPSADVIDAVGSQPIEYDKQKYYCHTTDKDQKVKYYQISLKKAMDGAQLGKFTKSVKVIYGLDDSSDLLQSILQNQMIHYGYELTQLNEGWFTDKLKQGIAAVKSFASKWYEKIVGLFNKIKEFGKSFLNGFNREIPSGRPNLYQINLITKALQESGELHKGELLTEGRQTKKSINEDLKNLNATGAKAVLREVNTQIKHIEDTFKGNEHLIGLIHPKGQVKDSEYTEDRRGKKSWALNDVIKLFANASALDAFIKIVSKNGGDIGLLKDQMIDLEREIYFGKTQLPLFKVYGALKPDDTDTVERLGTAKEFTASERGKITGKGTGFQWPVVGFSCTNQKKYYNVEGILLTGADETSNEPTFTQCRMGTNKADAFSFVIEGTAIKTWDQFKTKFSSDPAAKNWK
jgi:hypothetical protein